MGDEEKDRPDGVGVGNHLTALIIPTAVPMLIAEDSHSHLNRMRE